VLIAGCGGGAAIAPLSSKIAPSAATQAAHVTFTMRWGSSVTTSALRTPKYVGAARSIAVAVNGGVTQYLNAPATALVIDAPVGTDTFSFATYDEQNGQGDEISRALITKAIVLGAANTVTAVLNGIVASISLGLSNAAPNAGVAATEQIAVNAFDADGNLITGAGDYSTPIKLSVSDPANSGQVTLSTNVVQTRSQVATMHYGGGTLWNATIVGTATGLPSASVVFAPTPSFYQYALPHTSNHPQWITAGPDGNMWFTETPGNAVARITPAGVVNEFSALTDGANPEQIIAAGDGRLWFTEIGFGALGAVSTSGQVSQYLMASEAENPEGLTDRKDGTIWYAASGTNHVGYFAYAGLGYPETSVPTTNSDPFGIATGSDGNIYVTEAAADRIDRIVAPYASQSEYALTPGSLPESIVPGPDGNLWFTETAGDKIGVLQPSTFSVIAEYPVLTRNAGPTGLTVGADGALWFTEPGGTVGTVDHIGRVTTNGTVTEYPLPTTGYNVRGIAAARDGSLWFCEPGTSSGSAGRIGKLVY
jgi:streptogramin lyase